MSLFPTYSIRHFLVAHGRALEAQRPRQLSDQRPGVLGQDQTGGLVVQTDGMDKQTVFTQREKERCRTTRQTDRQTDRQTRKERVRQTDSRKTREERGESVCKR